MNDYNPDECSKKLKDGGFIPPCDDISQQLPLHCDNYGELVHETCKRHKDIGPYYPIQMTACVLRDEHDQILEYRYIDDPHMFQKCQELHNQTKQDWEPYLCFCCCACLAYGTPVETPMGARAIESVRTGDQVLAAAPNGASGDLSWKPAEVTFSGGAEGGTSQNMVYLGYGRTGPDQDLICSTDQVLMVDGGKLVRAGQLHHGDQLVDKDGNPVTIHTIAIGAYTGGVHHIGTATVDDLAAEHLVIVGGVVGGDYYMQLNYDSLPNGYRVDDAEERPQLWSADYTSRAGEPHPLNMIFEAPGGAKGTTPRSATGQFTAYSREPSRPEGISADLLTPAQAADVLANGHQINMSNPIPHYVAENIFKLLGGFHPDIDFYLDWADPTPNVYALSQYGRKIVIVTGGLARLKEIGYHGLIMAIAHGVERFSGQKPLDADGFSVTGLADYLAFAVDGQSIWWHPPEATVCPPVAYKDMSALFGLITPANSHADPDDPLDRPSVQCRLDCVGAGVAGASLPECAGGSPKIKVSLEDAVAQDAKTLVLTTNLLVTKDSAADTSHYVLTPPAPVHRAHRDSDSMPYHIHLAADLVPGHEYRIKIRDLVADGDHAGVDPDHDTRPFTVPT
ncbi:polymorphic toxin-type HINT domain-containing protein [Actinomadura sp. KC06]|uniref:polymorphic toxin-type HINT domain-containing protein n=1 Tax=Actinomadura sp. KC06 TaxID=2530369 RepID=UPI001404FFDD|nr:polymorphic toxin-type HINT domain-containing protein [Actinomadura sp. KC06]